MSVETPDVGQATVEQATVDPATVDQAQPGRPDEHVHAEGTAPHTHDGPLGYGVGHADVIFAYDTEDRMPVTYPGGTRPSDLAADLPLLVTGDSP